MKVTLYAIPAPGQSIYGEQQYLGTVRTHMHKAALTALAAWVKPVADVSIVDMQTQNPQAIKYGEIDFNGLVLEKYRVGTPFDEVAESIKESDIVGINANFTHSRLIAAHFAQYAKQTNKRCKVVVGGTDATAEPEYFLRNGADLVVKGEGELAFHHIIRNLSQGKDLSTIGNISYNEEGSFRHNPNSFLRDQFDVNSLPPHDLESVNLSTYTDTGEGQPPFNLQGPFISVETSRGCAQACTFCATPFAKGRYRYMGLEGIKKHFEYYKAKGVSTLLFQEDNVLSRVHQKPDGEDAYPKGREELLEMFYLAKEMAFAWEFTNGLEFGQYERQGRIDHELIDAMFWHESVNGDVKGCYRATIPLENLSDDSSKLFRKLKPLSKSKDVIKTMADTGVNTLSFNLIIGRPEDDLNILRLSYERCLEVREIVESAGKGTTVYFNIYNLSLLPGTVDHRRYRHLLAFDLEKDPEVITFYLGCLRTKYFDPLEITQARGSMAKTLNGNRLIDDFDENHFITSPRFLNLFS